ncbi:hypothetical protein HDU86_006085 [Geranomyces michiganensis]|nr:hypothetical protein HDU86_006085 [Geranomyces michiganensis]
MTAESNKPSNVVCEDGVCHIDWSKKKTQTPASGSSPNAAATAVDDAIKTHDVVIYSKTYCPYCDKAKALLKSKGQAFELVELDSVADGEAMHAHLKELTNQTSVPNIFIRGKHVGGCSDLVELDESGKLAEMLA